MHAAIKTALEAKEEEAWLLPRLLERSGGTVAVATANSFLEPLLEDELVETATTRMLARYLCELVFWQYSFLAHRPSKIAATSLRCALLLVEHNPSVLAGTHLWSESLQEASGYTSNALCKCVGELHSLFQGSCMDGIYLHSHSERNAAYGYGTVPHSRH